MSKILLIQGSLKPASRTAIVMREVSAMLAKQKVKHEVLDLREIEMQFCDGRELAKYNADMRKAYATLEKAKGYVVGMPVYQYTIAGPLKNFLDITMEAMTGKVTGIVCNSGGVRSYLAAADLVTSLSFESDVTTVQPIVHTYADDFKDGKLVNRDILPRIERMLVALLRDA